MYYEQRVDKNLGPFAEVLTKEDRRLHVSSKGAAANSQNAYAAE